MPSTSTDFTREREAVAVACRRLADEGLLIGTAGNVSVRVGELVAVTATGVVLAEAIPEDVTVVDLNGGPIAGEFEPTSELELHLGVYRRFEAGAVVHTHSRMATALSLVVDELPCVHYHQLLLGGAIRVAPFAVFGTPELAESVLAALDGKQAALMANHGALALGSSLQSAVENALLLEWACEVYQRAAAIGRPRELDPGQQQDVITAALARGYGSPRRIEEDTQ